MVGAALPEDAWLRYGHVRGDLAAVDAKIQTLNVEAMVRRGLDDDHKVQVVCELLEQQATLSAAFGEAAAAMCEAMREA